MKEKIIKKLTEKFSENNIKFSEFRDELTAQVNPKLIVEICKFLKDDSELLFLQCIDVTGIDEATSKNRFTVSYNLFSIPNNFRLRLKASIEGSGDSIDSVTSVWKSANWYERETFDMYGIVFNNHPDLRRMYMPEEFEYHPLRKDFPLMGIPGSLPLPQK